MGAVVQFFVYTNTQVKFILIALKRINLDDYSWAGGAFGLQLQRGRIGSLIFKTG